MRAFLFCFALGLSGAAAAQTTTTGLTLDFGQGQAAFIVGPGDCGNQISITWNATALGTPCSDIKIWVTTGNCGDTPGANDFQIQSAALSQANWPIQHTGIVQMNVSDLPIFASSDGGTSTCPLQIRKDLSVCGAYTYATPNFGIASCSSTTTVTATPPTITYAGVPPNPPTITDIVPLDSSLQVSVTADTATTFIHLFYRPLGGTDFTAGPSFTPDQGKAKITGLANGTTYEVEAIAEDQAGNQSNPSGIVEGTPVETVGFFDRYRQMGGQEQGGCTTAAGAPWVWAGGLLLAGFFLARRRRG